jgi:hypothetical protein
MKPCGRNQSTRNKRLRRRAGFPACCVGYTRLHRECGRRTGGRRQCGSHHHDKGNGGQVREQSWIVRPNRYGVPYFFSRFSRFPESILPTIGDHEPVFLEDLSHHRHGSRWAGSVDQPVIRLAPLVGAGQSANLQHCPVGGHFAYMRPIRHPAPRTLVQRCCAWSPR